MPDVKISELTELTFAQVDKFDYIPIVNVNDIAMGDGGICIDIWTETNSSEWDCNISIF